MSAFIRQDVADEVAAAVIAVLFKGRDKQIERHLSRSDIKTIVVESIKIYASRTVEVGPKERAS